MQRSFFTWASIFALTAVALGALGAHALKAVLEPERLVSFETGVRYQFYHALALFITSFAWAARPNALIKWAGWLFIAGIFCFSGSIYLLAGRQQLGIEHWSFLGPITPLGGLLFMAGWAVLLAGAWKKESGKS